MLKLHESAALHVVTLSLQHLGCTVVEPEELQEMVCEACMNKAPFLWTYAANFGGN